MTVNEQLSALEQILARSDIHSLFQPIVSLSERRIIGYEALSRGLPTVLCTPRFPCSPLLVRHSVCPSWKWRVAPRHAPVSVI